MIDAIKAVQEEGSPIATAAMVHSVQRHSCMIE